MVMTPAEVQALIVQRAREYAAAQGRPADGDDFARVALIIAGGESNYYPGAGNDRGEQSIGIYQLNFAPGSADRAGRKRGLTRDEARDPDRNISATMPDLFTAFVGAGGSAAYRTNPGTVTYRTWQQAQRPSQQALDTHGVQVIRAGVSAVADLSQLPQSLPTRSTGQTATGATIGGTSVSSPTATTTATDPYKVEWDETFRRKKALDAEYDRIVTKQQRGESLNDAELTFITQTYPAGSTTINQTLQRLQPFVTPGRTDSPAQTQQVQTDAARLQLEREKFGYQQTTDVLASAFKAAEMALGTDSAALAALTAIVTANQTDARAVVESQLRKGELTQAGAATMLNAYNAELTQKAARSLQSLATAKFIADEQWQMAERLLPPEVEYQYGYAPDSPTNVLFERMGLPKQLIKVQQVDRSRFEPENILARADTALTQQGYGRPDFSEPIGAARETYNQAQAILPYKGQPITVDGKVPSDVKMPESLASYVDTWMDRIGALRPDTGGGGEPPPDIDSTMPATAPTSAQQAAMSPEMRRQAAGLPAQTPAITAPPPNPAPYGYTTTAAGQQPASPPFTPAYPSQVPYSQSRDARATDPTAGRYTGPPVTYAQGNIENPYEALAAARGLGPHEIEDVRVGPDGTVFYRRKRGLAGVGEK